MKPSPDIIYLQQPEIGKVIARGLAILYREQPRFPIDYLAKWLLNNSSACLSESAYEATLQRKIELQAEALELEKKRQEEEARIESIRQEILNKDSVMRDSISSSEYPLELLDESFPEFLEKRKNLTGVYVGVLEHPTKIIDEIEEDEMAHLDTSQVKRICYIGSSKSHKFVKGLMLSLEQGVTADVWKEPIVEEPIDGKEIAPEKPRWVYIPNVVKEPRMNFFKIPKLGAFFACPLVFNSCLSEQAFDAALEERIKYKKASNEQEKEIETKTNAYNDACTEKQNAGEDTTEITNEFEAWKNGLEKVSEPQFVSIKREYVVGMDTLGQDREIILNDQNFLNDFVSLFAKSVEEREKTELSKDIDVQISYLEGLTTGPKELAEQYNLEEEHFVEENKERLEKFTVWEKELLYETECLKLEKLSSILGNNEVKEWIFGLNRFRVLKYSGILQTILYFFGYEKKDVNLENTNVLNWKIVKHWINEELLHKILDYDHRGQKPEQVRPYAKIAHLQKKLEKYNPEDVDNYNIGYGRLLRWIVLTLKLRKLNIEIRREKQEKERNRRFDMMDENEKIKNQREVALEEHKAQIPPEEIEEFNAEEWLKVWDEEHPLHEIAEEIIPDIDGDIDAE